MRLIALVVLALVACGSTPPPVPRPFGSPGPLIAGHAALACLDCHAGADAAIDQAKCSACHRAIATGLHALPEMRRSACVSCHLDHRGAGFDALGWRTVRGGRDGFDHERTGWPLNGAHGRATCESCHATKTPLGRPTFLGAARACAGCHSSQPHGFERAAACGRCHTTAAWAPPKRVLAFDHGSSADARVPVTGAHEKVACVQCHPAGRFSLGFADPARCENCHQTPHGAKPYAAVACARCHDTSTFTAIARYKHVRFEPGASHRGVACARCHTAAWEVGVPSPECETCHAARAPHADRFKAFGRPAACATCHAATSVTWKPNAFDHTKKGRWRLERFHTNATCRSCHRGTTPADFERLGRGPDCLGCHEHSTVHADEDHPKGRFSNPECLQCHTL